MEFTNLFKGAALLNEGVQLFTLVAGPKAEAAAGLRIGLLNQASKKVLFGAGEVRNLGGPFFNDLAARIEASAASALAGESVAPAITDSLEGASWLYRRIADPLV